MTTMLPCKCGREPTILRRTPMVGGLFRAIASRVECTPCEESTQAWHDTDELAVAAWNLRASPPSVDWAEEGPVLLDALRRAEPLMRMLTIGQIIGGGDDAISASGLNPWCINEGLADSTERYNAWWLGAAIARATPGGETRT